MTNNIPFIKKNNRNLFHIGLFLLTVGLIVLMLPRKGKFHYEYTMGAPWKHEDLIAPSSFAIYKLDQELKSEKDSIARNAPRYYEFDESRLSSQINRFSVAFDTTWNRVFGAKLSQRTRKQCRTDAISLLEFIYNKGIIESLPGNESTEKEQPLVVVRGHIAETYYPDDLFTIKSAYEYARNELRKFYSHHLESELRQSNLYRQVKSGDVFVNELKVNEFISSNINYNSKLSKKYLDDQLQNVSATRGMVQAGQAIILKGEVVDVATFRILETMRKDYEKDIGQSAQNYVVVLGQTLLVFLALLVFYLFLFNYEHETLQETKRVLFLLLMVLVPVSLNVLILDSRLSPYLIPLALLPVIIKSFFNWSIALVTTISTALIVGYILPNGFEYVFIQTIGSIMAIFTLKDMQRRSQLLRMAGYVLLTYWSVYVAIGTIQQARIDSIKPDNFLWLGGSCLILLTAYPLIYMLERVFGFLSDITLIELSDLNHPALRNLAENAPGTFQHSIQVANLAESATRAIGGNPLLARAGALYHDIGKVKSPVFFVENTTHTKNPHEELEYEQSARLIIEHVKNGVELARKHRIPDQIIDFIRTHHGTTKTQYFYRSFKNKYPGVSFDPAVFTYPGPSPISKETAVVMMADSVEAATRSLKSITQHSIAETIEHIIDYQIKENQFINAEVTFRDISRVKEVFRKKLLNVYHPRVEYPQEMDELRSRK